MFYIIICSILLGKSKVFSMLIRVYRDSRLTHELDPAFLHVQGRTQVPIDEVHRQVEGLPVKPVHFAHLHLEK